MASIDLRSYRFNGGSGGGGLQPHTQTTTTTDATLTTFPTSKTITTNTTTRFKSVIIGRRTNAPVGNIYYYEIEGVCKNVLGTVTLGNITGTIIQEDDVLGVDATTGHAISVVVNGTALDFKITGAVATSITWKIETTFSEV